MKTTQQKLTKGLTELKAQVEEWHKGEFSVEYWQRHEYQRQLELDMYDTFANIWFAVEEDEGFIEPEECRDTDREDSVFKDAVAAHTEELADTLEDSENALALRVLASYWKKIAHISGKTPGFDFEELVRAFGD